MSYIGAGILPYYYNEGQAYFVLGCDKMGYYSDWGGSPDPNEPIFDCAARECAEEMGTRALGNQTDIKTRLTNSRQVTHLPITKRDNRLYHLFLLQVKESHLWTHQENDCRCFSCSFEPTDEKIAIRCFPANALYEAVANGTGQIIIENQIFALRDVFINEIRAIPSFPHQ